MSIVKSLAEAMGIQGGGGSATLAQVGGSAVVDCDSLQNNAKEYLTKQKKFVAEFSSHKLHRRFLCCKKKRNQCMLMFIFSL